MASRQLSAEMSRRVGADWVDGVTDMARGILPWQEQCLWLQGSRCAPPRASGLNQIDRGRARRLSPSLTFRAADVPAGNASGHASRHWINPASVSRFCWNLAMLSNVVLASCLPVIARSSWSCSWVSSSKNCGTCHTSFCQSSEAAQALFHGRYVTYLGSEYTDLMADWPPAAANWGWISGDSHHFTNSTASLIWASVVQVVSTKGWPPMLDQRTILPSLPLVPGIRPNTSLSATFEVFGSSEASPRPIQLTAMATLPSRNSSSDLKMSMVPVLATGGMYSIRLRYFSRAFTASGEFTTPSAWPLGAFVSSQMSPPICQMKPLTCMDEKSYALPAWNAMP